MKKNLALAALAAPAITSTASAETAVALRAGTLGVGVDLDGSSRTPYLWMKGGRLAPPPRSRRRRVAVPDLNPRLLEIASQPIAGVLAS